MHRSFKSKQSLEYIEAVLRDFNRDFQARADLAVAAVIVGGTGSSSSIGSYQGLTAYVIRGVDSSIASTQAVTAAKIGGRGGSKGSVKTTAAVAHGGTAASIGSAKAVTAVVNGELDSTGYVIYVPASYIMYRSDFCRFLLCTCGWGRRGEREGWSGGGVEGGNRMYTVWVQLTVNCTHGYS